VETTTEREVHSRRRPLLGGGPDGNDRLTSTLGLVLFVLLGLEAATTLSLHDYLSVHLFLGLLLIPPVAVKLASAGWRFARYYTRSEPYRLRGPPDPWLRMLAPPLVLATIVLFGTGVAFLVVGRGGGLLLTVHAASFAVWGGLVSVHALAYLSRGWRHGSADWRRAGGRADGATARRYAVVGALVAGVAIGLGTYSAQTSWLAHRHHPHRFEARG
jgi:hypothetical protein